MSEPLANILKTVDNIKSAWELGNSEMVAADAAKLAAQLAAGVAVESLLRTYSALDGLGRTLSLWRLDMAISGRSIAGHQALAGVIAGEAVGRFIDAVRALDLGMHLYDFLHPELNRLVESGFRSSAPLRPAPVYHDPLAIDLAGDGIQTIGIGAAPVLFDHDADGIRTGTGWLSGQDAWLVLDRNANGAIDSGRELFGVDYVKSDGQLAGSGFDALRDLDANGDNVFDSADAAYTQVRLWQDLDQDGVSQSGELFTLAQKNIAAIALSPTTATTDLGNGNAVSAAGTVIRSDASTTTAGAVDLNLATNPFYRDFTDAIALSDAARALPEMQGAGWVRDLREAMNGDRPPPRTTLHLSTSTALMGREVAL